MALRGQTGARFSAGVFGAMIAALLLMAGTGCGLIESRRPPSLGDLFWEQEPSAGDAAQIIDRWKLDWDPSGAPMFIETRWAGSRGSSVVLGMRGTLPVKEPDQSAALSIVQVVEKATLDLQNQGVLVRGLHLDLGGQGKGLERADSTRVHTWLKDLYRGVRKRLDPSVELSATTVTLDVAALESEVSQVAPALDWVLVGLYGQPYGVADDPRLWDLEEGLDRLRVARAQEIPSRGLVTLDGSLSRRRDDRSTPLSPRLECGIFTELAKRSDSVFQFEGYFRQVFQADSRESLLVIGETTLPLSGQVQVTRTTADHLRKLRKGVEQLGDEKYLGTVYTGLSRDPDNCLGLDQRALDQSMGPLSEPPTVSLERLANGRLQLTLSGGSEPTALGMKRYNYVDLMADAGLVDRVEVVDFPRYEFLDGSHQPMPGMSGRGVRLFLPLLEPGRQASATVRIRGAKSVVANPVFRSATGDSLETAAARWPQAKRSEDS